MTDRRHARPLRWRDPLRKAVLFVFALGFGMWILFPFYWMITSSVSTPAELGAVPPHWIPQHPTLDNYIQVTTGETTKAQSAYGSGREGQRFPRTLLYSFLSASRVAAYNLVVGTIAGYSFARFHFFGSRSHLPALSRLSGVTHDGVDHPHVHHLPQPGDDRHTLGADHLI